MALIDSFGRKINYLRLSVTDRCNLRCQYCMPASGVAKKDHREILRFEELYRIAAAATELGVEKIRLTGGEPLVRKGILNFIDQLSHLPKLKELVLTSNGVMLADMAEALAVAGVQRLNISLDSLKSETFAKITRTGDLARVLEGIRVAEEAGLPVKINTVVMRGINDDEILDFVRMTLEKKMSVRFIEYMPVIKATGWQSLVLTGEEILARIARELDIEPLEAERICGPARMYQVKGASGSFGLITPLSGHFCAECNRIRVSADGCASSCLFSNQQVDLRAALAKGGDIGLLSAFRDMTRAKPEGHQLSTLDAPHEPFVMANIGG